MPDLPVKTPWELGALIRDRRRALGLDQAKLAVRVGVSRLWINQIERGKLGASVGLVLRTLDVLGITLMSHDELSGHAPLGEPVVTPDIDAILARAREQKR